MRRSDLPERGRSQERTDPAARLSGRLARLADAHPSSESAEVHPPWPDDWTEHGPQQPDRQAAEAQEAESADQDATQTQDMAGSDDARPGRGEGRGRHGFGDAQVGSEPGRASYRPWFATGSSPDPWFAAGPEGPLAGPDPAGPDA